MEKGWKGLVGHPNDREKCSNFSLTFYFPYTFFLSLFISFVSVSNSNWPFDVCFYEKKLPLLLSTGALVFKFRGRPDLFHTLMFPSGEK